MTLVCEQSGATSSPTFVLLPCWVAAGADAPVLEAARQFAHYVMGRVRHAKFSFILTVPLVQTPNAAGPPTLALTGRIDLDIIAGRNVPDAVQTRVLQDVAHDTDPRRMVNTFYAIQRALGMAWQLEYAHGMPDPADALALASYVRDMGLPVAWLHQLLSDGYRKVLGALQDAYDQRTLGAMAAARI